MASSYSTTTNTANQDEMTSQQRYWIDVTEKLPSIDDCTTFVNDPSCGAITTFIGTTRNNYQGKIVTKLSYEGYIPMAKKELYKLCEEATTKYDIRKIVAVHIIGDCPVGTPSVILVCSSPHRKAAIEGIEFLINTLKATVPIWKLECYEHDTAVWKENIEWKNNGRQQQRIMVRQPTQAAPPPNTEK
jgi:molybdopterin synthase catalytic subunit